VTTPIVDEASRVREFWFGKTPMSTQSLERRIAFWFGDDEPPELRRQRNDIIARRFGELIERAASGHLAGWADSPRRRLSLIILLDQFPRNLYRGTARAFSYDEQALGLTLSGMQSAADGALDVVERIFFYMPLQHAEVREVQDESVAAYRRLLTEAPEEMRRVFEATLQFAEAHRSVIERFGRFPQRNAALQRSNTREESLYMQSGSAADFGQ
jgi:uncharacterized protein (DUF924 family)